MNLLNMKWPYATVAFVAIILGGCATTQPIPDLSSPQSAGFGIDVTMKAPIGIFSAKPDQVYFVKIDNENDLLQQQIIRSNYSKGSRAYLLNARPGTYVAVASFFSRAGAPAGPTSPGFSVSVTTGRSGYTTYFSKELVEHSKVTVRENDFAFMGSYVVDSSVGLEGADGVQTHYKNVIAPGETTGLLGMAFGGSIHYRGALRERKADEQAQAEFLQKAKDDLAGSGWVTLIK